MASPSRREGCYIDSAPAPPRGAPETKGILLTEAAPSPSRLGLLGWICVLAAGALFRCFELGAGDLWIDEGYTALVSALPFDELLRTIAIDVHPPGYFLTVKAARMGLGSASAFALRLPSLLFELGSLAVVAGFFRRHLPPSGALVGTAFFAGCVTCMRSAQLARMYSASAFFSLLVWVAAVEFAREGKSRDAIAAGLATAAALASHYFSAFMILGAWLEVVRTRRWNRVWVGSQLAAFAALGGWLAYSLPIRFEAGRTLSQSWRQPISAGSSLLKALAVPANWMTGRYVYEHGSVGPGILATAGLVVGIFVCWQKLTGTEKSAVATVGFALGTCAALQPFTGELVILDRYLQPLAPLVFLIAGRLASELAEVISADLRSLLGTVVFLVLLAPGAGYSSSPRPEFLRPFAQLWKRNPPEVFLTLGRSWDLMHTARDVAEGRSMASIHLLRPDDFPPWTQEYSQKRNNLGALLSVSSRGIPERIATTARAGGRVWLFYRAPFFPEVVAFLQSVQAVAGPPRVVTRSADEEIYVIQWGTGISSHTEGSP